VKWAAQWSQKEIEAGRARDRRAKQAYFAESADRTPAHTVDAAELPLVAPRQSLWSRVKKRFRV
jgi:hypothetical protein